MEFTNLLDAKNRRELREWLINNHDREKECWVIVKRGRPVDDDTFWYIDSVEEAMCFGWIDSTTKKMDNGVTSQRLTPRRKGSLWSELNKERCRRMERLGLEQGRGGTAYFRRKSQFLDYLCGYRSFLLSVIKANGSTDGSMQQLRKKVWKLEQVIDCVLGDGS